MTISDEIRLDILRILVDEPGISQRELAKRLDVSLGKANYCLRALIDRGWVKLKNFRNNDNKKAYFYFLTPGGVEKKAELTARFLQYKMREYDTLREEITKLYQEVHGTASDTSVPGSE